MYLCIYHLSIICIYISIILSQNSYHLKHLLLAPPQISCLHLSQINLTLIQPHCYSSRLSLYQAIHGILISLPTISQIVSSVTRSLSLGLPNAASASSSLKVPPLGYMVLCVFWFSFTFCL